MCLLLSIVLRDNWNHPKLELARQTFKKKIENLNQPINNNNNAYMLHLVQFGFIVKFHISNQALEFQIFRLLPSPIGCHVNNDSIWSPTLKNELFNMLVKLTQTVSTADNRWLVENK